MALGGERGVLAVSRTVTCRDCHRVGVETDDDPAPGLCPVCLDVRLARATEDLAALDATSIEGGALDRHARDLLVDAGLVEPYLSSFLALTRPDHHPPIVLTLPVVHAIVLLGNLQLALRYPSNTGAPARTARRIAEQLQTAIVAHVPEIAQFLDQGWDPTHDQEIPR